ASSDTPVRDIMTADVVTVRLDDTADRCMQIVTESRIRHLPVVERDAVLGVVSIGDLVKAVIEDQQRQLDQLQRYIESGPARSGPAAARLFRRRGASWAGEKLRQDVRGRSRPRRCRS